MNRCLLLCAFVASLFTGISEAGMPLAECGQEIAGCGVGQGTENDDLWCNCLSSLDSELVQFSFNLFCGLEFNIPSCCPCSGAAALAGTSQNDLGCADPRDVRLLRRLIKKARRVGDRLAAKCPNEIDESCAPRRLIRKLDALNCGIITTSNRIDEDCNIGSK